MIDFHTQEELDQHEKFVEREHQIELGDPSPIYRGGRIKCAPRDDGYDDATVYRLTRALKPYGESYAQYLRRLAERGSWGQLHDWRAGVL